MVVLLGCGPVGCASPDVCHETINTLYSPLSRLREPEGVSVSREISKDWPILVSAPMHKLNAVVADTGDIRE